MKYLTVEDAAECLQIPKWSMYELVREGKIPHVRIGRRIRIRATSLEQWMQDMERGGDEPQANDEEADR